MNYLFVINDPPYGTERAYNGLRLARELLKNEETGNSVKIFLMGDGVACAKKGQIVPKGYYHVESFLQTLVRNQARIGACTSCMDARGIGDAELVDGVHRGNLAELAQFTEWADKTLIF